MVKAYKQEVYKHPLTKHKNNEKHNRVSSTGGVCIFVKNSREVTISFKTKVDVSIIFINLRG